VWVLCNYAAMCPIQFPRQVRASLDNHPMVPTGCQVTSKESLNLFSLLFIGAGPERGEANPDLSSVCGFWPPADARFRNSWLVTLNDVLAGAPVHPTNGVPLNRPQGADDFCCVRIARWECFRNLPPGGFHFASSRQLVAVDGHCPCQGQASPGDDGYSFSAATPSL
jgi:hypothetical protein